MLQRVYAISFPKASMLEEHLNMLEEAKRRDHNKLGRELELFTIGRWCYFFYKNETGQIVWSLVDPCEVDVCDIDEGYEDLKFEKYKDAINKYEYSFLQTREYLKKYCLLDPKVAFPFHN